MNHLRQRCLSLFSILFPSNTPSFFLYPVYITLFLRKHFNSKPFSYRSDFYLTAISLAKAFFFFFWQSTHKLKPYHGKLMKNEMDPRKSVLFNSASQTIPVSSTPNSISISCLCNGLHLLQMPVLQGQANLYSDWLIASRDLSLNILFSSWLAAVIRHLLHI